MFGPVMLASISYEFVRRGLMYNAIQPAEHGIHSPGTVYFTQETTIQKDADRIQRLVDGILAGWTMVYADYDKSVPVLVSFDPMRLTSDMVRFQLEQQREFLRPFGARFGEFDEDQWRSLQAMLLQLKLIPDTIDISGAVSFDFLRDAYRRRSPTDDFGAKNFE